MKIGGELLFFAEEKFLFPDAARAAVVVVAGYDQNRDFQAADGGAGGGNRGFGGVGGIEHVSGDEDEIGGGGCGEFRNAADGMQALLLESEAFCVVANRGKRFAKLPVCGVKKNKAHEDVDRTRGIW